MFIIKFLRYLFGFVEFRASGGFPERFINLCTKNEIPLWDVKRNKTALFASTTVKGYKSIKDSARRAGTSVKIINKKGLPFITNRQKKRMGILIGFAAAAVLIMFLSTMVWTVSVEGNQKISEERISKVFSSLGVRMGARRKALDTAQIVDEALRQFEGELSWASVNLDGSKAVIEVRESIPVPPITDTKTPCNIVASEDGVITKIHLYSGQEEIKVGSAVTKGDLLISGVKINLDKSETLMHADGYVYAKNEKQLSSQLANCVFFKESQERIKYTLYFFGLKIPFGFSKLENSAYTVETYVDSNGLALPIGIIRERECEYNSLTEVSDEKCQKLLAAKKYSDSYRKLFESSDVITKEFGYAHAKYQGIYICEKQIGVKQEIFVEKN